MQIYFYPRLADVSKFKIFKNEFFCILRSTKNAYFCVFSGASDFSSSKSTPATTSFKSDRIVCIYELSRILSKFGKRMSTSIVFKSYGTSPFAFKCFDIRAPPGSSSLITLSQFVRRFLNTS